MYAVLLLLVLLVALPASAGPLGTAVAGLEPGVVRFEAAVDYGYRPVYMSPFGSKGEELAGPTGVSTGGVSVALTLEPVPYVAVEARALLHKSAVQRSGRTFPVGWGLAGVLRLTPIHFADDRVHMGFFGSFDAQMIRYPSSGWSPLRIWNLRVGSAVAFGNAQKGYYVELGTYYSHQRGWLTVTHYMDPSTDGDCCANHWGYRLYQTPPIGTRIGAGLFSKPLSPNGSGRTRIQVGFDLRMTSGASRSGSAWRRDGVSEAWVHSRRWPAQGVCASSSPRPMA